MLAGSVKFIIASGPHGIVLAHVRATVLIFYLVSAVQESFLGTDSNGMWRRLYQNFQRSKLVYVLCSMQYHYEVMVG